jgi:hypothetical protein
VGGRTFHKTVDRASKDLAETKSIKRQLGERTARLISAGLQVIASPLSFCGNDKLFTRHPSLPLPPAMTPAKPSFPPGAETQQYAQSLDAEDHLRSFRDQFIIPSKSNIKSKKLEKAGRFQDSPSPLCTGYMPLPSTARPDSF